MDFESHAEIVIPAAKSKLRPAGPTETEKVEPAVRTVQVSHQVEVEQRARSERSVVLPKSAATPQEVVSKSPQVGPAREVRIPASPATTEPPTAGATASTASTTSDDPTSAAAPTEAASTGKVAPVVVAPLASLAAAARTAAWRDEMNESASEPHGSASEPHGSASEPHGGTPVAPATPQELTASAADAPAVGAARVTEIQIAAGVQPVVKSVYAPPVATRDVASKPAASSESDAGSRAAGSATAEEIRCDAAAVVAPVRSDAFSGPASTEPSPPSRALPSQQCAVGPEVAAQSQSVGASAQQRSAVAGEAQRDFIIAYDGHFIGHFQSTRRIMTRSAFHKVARALLSSMSPSEFDVRKIELYKPIPLRVDYPESLEEISDGSFEWFARGE